MGRPRKYHTEEERQKARKYDKYKRDLPHDHEQRVSRLDAAYVPERDGEPIHRDLTALLCGDPPIGRSAFDKRQLRLVKS